MKIKKNLKNFMVVSISLLALIIQAIIVGTICPKLIVICPMFGMIIGSCCVLCLDIDY